METFLVVAGVVCSVGGAVWTVFAAVRWAARRGYRRCKAGFHIGRSGFYIEADDRDVTALDRREGRP
jgi:hypothetical protein